MNISLLNGVSEIVQAIKDFFFGILYWILKALCYVVDLCQILVKKLAGIDVDGLMFGNEIVNGSENSSTVTGDIVEILLRSDIVRNLFISLLVLGIILLLIVTFVGVWKTEWEFGKEGNSKTKIINASLKALFNFIAVPVVAFFGIFVGNALLRAIDGATKGDTNKSITSFVLSSAFSDASRYTYKNEGNNAMWVNANLQVVYALDEGGNKKIDENGNFIIEAQGILNLFKDSKQDVHVDEILDAFQNNQGLSKKVVEEGKYRIFTSDGEIDARYTEALTSGEFKFTFEDNDLVSMFFDNSKINYVIIYIILIFMIKAMLTITFGLVKRLYYIVVLFIISPPIVAISPLNDKALGSWRSMFIANVCSAFVTIALYNIFLSIYPIFAKIKFPGVGSFVNFFVQLLMISVGLMTIDGLSQEIAKLFGVKELYGESTDKGKTLWGGAFKTAGSGFTPFTLGAKAVGKGVQYGTTAKYLGLGAAAKQMGADVKNTATKVANTGPMADFWKATNIGSAGVGFKNAKEIKNKLGVKDKSQKISEAKNDAEQAFLGYANNLGLDTSLGSAPGIGALQMKNNYNKIKNSADASLREQYLSMQEKLQELKTNSPDDKKAIYAQARKMRDFLTSNNLKHEDVLRYKNEQEAIEAYENYKSLNRSTKAVIKGDNGVKQSQGAQKKAESAKEAMAKQAAMTDAKNKVIYEEMVKANKKMDEAKKAATKQESTKILNEAKKDIEDLRKKLSDIGDLEKIDKKIDKLLSKKK